MTMHARELWKEFKGFALKGNLIDLAVAVLIGNAFGGVVNALVKNVVMPLFSYISPDDSYRSWKLGRVEVGIFLGELINFLIIALVLFVVFVKVMGTIRKIGFIPPDAPTTQECPFCFSVIPTRASKCAHCTADLPPQESGTGHGTED
jgi:large conductance mechanosensitive channel